MLKVSNLNASYNSVSILKDINAEFKEGTFNCIIGKNGCGKSTLLKCIEGLVENASSIEYNSINLNTISNKERAKIVSYLPQIRPTPSISGKLMVEHGRFPYLSFQKNLTENDKEIVEDAIIKTNTSNLMKKKLDQMSGGEVQKIYIASTIAQQTEVILLDEPTNHLDLESQIEILNLVNKLKEEGKTIIVVLHDLLQAFTYADEIFLINDSKLVAHGSPKELKNNQLIKDIFKYNIVEDNDQNSLYKYKLVD